MRKSKECQSMGRKCGILPARKVEDIVDQGYHYLCSRVRDLRDGYKWVEKEFTTRYIECRLGGNKASRSFELACDQLDVDNDDFESFIDSVGHIIEDQILGYYNFLCAAKNGYPTSTDYQLHRFFQGRNRVEPKLKTPKGNCIMPELFEFKKVKNVKDEFEKLMKQRGIDSHVTFLYYYLGMTVDSTIVYYLVDGIDKNIYLDIIDKYKLDRVDKKTVVRDNVYDFEKSISCYGRPIVRDVLNDLILAEPLPEIVVEQCIMPQIECYDLYDIVVLKPDCDQPPVNMLVRDDKYPDYDKFMKRNRLFIGQAMSDYNNYKRNKAKFKKYRDIVKSIDKSDSFDKRDEKNVLYGDVKDKPFSNKYISPTGKVPFEEFFKNLLPVWNCGTPGVLKHPFVPTACLQYFMFSESYYNNDKVCEADACVESSISQSCYNCLSVLPYCEKEVLSYVQGPCLNESIVCRQCHNQYQVIAYESCEGIHLVCNRCYYLTGPYLCGTDFSPTRHFERYKCRRCDCYFNGPTSRSLNYCFFCIMIAKFEVSSVGYK